MNKRELQKKLSLLQTAVVPNQDWKKTQRAFLASRMKAQVSENPIQPAKFEFAMNFGRQLARPVGAFGVGLLVIFGSLAASVTASTSSLPGDKLYSLKLTSERIHVSLVTDKKAKTDLQISHAKKRVEEIKEVVKREHDPVKANKQIQKPLQNLKVTVASVKMAVEAAQDNNEDEALTLAKALKDVTVSASIAVRDAEIAQAPTEDPAQEPALDDMSLETKKVVESTVSASSETQLAVIKKITEKDSAKGKDALLAYVQEFKNDNGLNPAPVVEALAAPAAELTALAAEPAAETSVPAEEPASDEPVAEVTEEPATDSVEEPVLTEEELAAKKVAEEAAAAEAAAKAKIAEDKAKAEAEKLNALKEMVALVEDFIAKDDIMAALEILIVYHQPKNVTAETPAEPAKDVEEVKTEEVSVETPAE